MTAQLPNIDFVQISPVSLLRLPAFPSKFLRLLKCLYDYPFFTPALGPERALFNSGAHPPIRP